MVRALRGQGAKVGGAVRESHVLTLEWEAGPYRDHWTPDGRSSDVRKVNMCGEECQGQGPWAREDSHCLEETGPGLMYLSGAESLSLAVSQDLDSLGIWLPWQSSITSLLAHHSGSLCGPVHFTHCPI